MGGINHRKGTDLLVEAFQRVSGPARLVIHSQVPAAAYGGLATGLERDPRIQFVEGTVSAPGLYHRGDVYVYPTRLEGIGLTVAEALACGLPVITTDVPPCSEFVEPGLNGWLVPVARTRRRSDGYYWPETECDVGALAAQLQQCVERRAERPVWRRRAREYAEARLDWRKNASGLTEEVSRLLASPPSPLPQRLQQAILRAHPDRRDLVGRLRRRAIRQLAAFRH